MAKFLTSLGPLAPIAVMLLTAGESAAFLGLVVPGEIAVILGGVVAGTGAVPVWLMAAAAVMGAILGDSIGYYWGKRLGPAVSKKPRYEKLTRHLDAASRLIGERGWWALVVARFTSLLRAVVPFAAGMGKMPYPRFFLGNAIGGVAWGVTFTVVGYLAGANYARVEKWFRTGGLILAVVVVLVGSIVWATRWVGQHPEEVQARLAPVLRLPPVAFVVRHATSAGRGRTLVLSALGVGSALWLFGALAQDVLGRDEFFFFDRSILTYLHDHQLAPVVRVARVINDATQPGWVIGGATVMAAGALIRHRPRMAGALAIALVGQWAIIEGVEALIQRAAPPLTPLAPRADYGFPSEHVAAVAALLIIVAWPWSRPRWAIAVRRFGGALILIVLTAAARVTLLIEYPSDVLAATGVAVAWAILVAVAVDPTTGVQFGGSEPAHD